MAEGYSAALGERSLDFPLRLSERVVVILGAPTSPRIARATRLLSAISAPFPTGPLASGAVGAKTTGNVSVELTPLPIALRTGGRKARRSAGAGASSARDSGPRRERND